MLFPYRSLQSIEESSLCYTVILISYLFYIQQRTYVNPNVPIYPFLSFSLSNCKVIFYIYDSVL